MDWQYHGLATLMKHDPAFGNVIRKKEQFSAIYDCTTRVAGGTMFDAWYNALMTCGNPWLEPLKALAGNVITGMNEFSVTSMWSGVSAAPMGWQRPLTAQSSESIGWGAGTALTFCGISCYTVHVRLSCASARWMCRIRRRSVICGRSIHSADNKNSCPLDVVANHQQSITGGFLAHILKFFIYRYLSLGIPLLKLHKNTAQGDNHSALYPFFADPIVTVLFFRW